jgi:2-oxo-4-hydroxy-4-carboxy-5-ureidoimidazoline decarboxylase
MDRIAFTRALGHLFEHSPWVAEGAWARRPFASADALHRELCLVMRSAPHERQLDLIRAHPDLAGRIAQQNLLTADSKLEQSTAGLDCLGDDELREFQNRNDAYRDRFGFPFIVCARSSNKGAILDAMRERLNNTPGQEFDTALLEIEKIARLRLDAVIRSAAPAMQPHGTA